jgi:hypothetical protein
VPSPSDFPEKVWLRPTAKYGLQVIYDQSSVRLYKALEAEVQPYFSAQCMEELVEAGCTAWSEIEEALDRFGEGMLDETDLLVRLRAAQSNLLPCTRARSLLEVKG